MIFFEFLFDLDEEIAGTDWWDEGNRFLKAGVLGMIMQKLLSEKVTACSSTYKTGYIETLIICLDGQLFSKGLFEKTASKDFCSPAQHSPRQKYKIYRQQHTLNKDGQWRRQLYITIEAIEGWNSP
jgi:hypothetical protein